MVMLFQVHTHLHTPPEVETETEPTVSELLKRIEILESQVSGSN